MRRFCAEAQYKALRHKQNASTRVVFLPQGDRARESLSLSLEAFFPFSLGHLVPGLFSRVGANRARRHGATPSGIPLGQNVAVNTSSNPDIRPMRSISPKIPRVSAR